MDDRAAPPPAPHLGLLPSVVVPSARVLNDSFSMGAVAAVLMSAGEQGCMQGDKVSVTAAARYLSLIGIRRFADGSRQRDKDSVIAATSLSFAGVREENTGWK